jgi:hypothetical protein
MIQKNAIFIDLCCKVLAAVRVIWKKGRGAGRGEGGGGGSRSLLYTCHLPLRQDRAWQKDLAQFVIEANMQVKEVMAANQSRYKAFLDLETKRGVEWPHKPGMLNLALKCKFQFAPTVIKRDRVVCAECKAEISGWRAWHKPWVMHNPAAHSPEFNQSMADMESLPTADGRALVLGFHDQKEPLDGVSRDASLVEAFLRSRRYQVQTTLSPSSQLNPEVLGKVLKAVCDARPAVGHVLLYFVGSVVRGEEGGEADFILLRTLFWSWVSSNAAKDGAHLQLVFDCAFSGRMITLAAEKLRESGVFLTIQSSSDGATGVRDGAFARSWITVASGAKKLSDVAPELRRANYKPRIFSLARLPLDLSSAFPLLALEV